MNDTTAQPLADAYRQAAVRCLVENLALIEHCVGQLDEEQLWWRPTPAQNSIANLLLHLTGNLRQWILAGVAGAEDRRDRPAEFQERQPLPRTATLNPLRDVVQQCCTALRNVTPAELTETRRVQGFQLTATDIIFDAVSHFRGHAQEIASLTRQQLGDSYQFNWVPQSPEQGAGD